MSVVQQHTKKIQWQGESVTRESVMWRVLANAQPRQVEVLAHVHFYDSMPKQALNFKNFMEKGLELLEDWTDLLDTVLDEFERVDIPPSRWTTVELLRVLSGLDNEMTAFYRFRSPRLYAEIEEELGSRGLCPAFLAEHYLSENPTDHYALHTYTSDLVEKEARRLSKRISQQETDREFLSLPDRGPYVKFSFEPEKKVVHVLSLEESEEEGFKHYPIAHGITYDDNDFCHTIGMSSGEVLESNPPSFDDLWEDNFERELRRERQILSEFMDLESPHYLFELKDQMFEDIEVKVDNIRLCLEYDESNTQVWTIDCELITAGIAVVRSSTRIIQLWKERLGCKSFSEQIQSLLAKDLRLFLSVTLEGIYKVCGHIPDMARLIHTMCNDPVSFITSFILFVFKGTLDKQWKARFGQFQFCKTHVKSDYLEILCCMSDMPSDIFSLIQETMEYQRKTEPYGMYTINQEAEDWIPTLKAGSHVGYHSAGPVPSHLIYINGRDACSPYLRGDTNSMALFTTSEVQSVLWNSVPDLLTALPLFTSKSECDGIQVTEFCRPPVTQGWIIYVTNYGMGVHPYYHTSLQIPVRYISDIAYTDHGDLWVLGRRYGTSYTSRDVTRKMEVSKIPFMVSFFNAKWKKIKEDERKAQSLRFYYDGKKVEEVSSVVGNLYPVKLAKVMIEAQCQDNLQAVCLMQLRHMINQKFAESKQTPSLEDLD